MIPARGSDDSRSGSLPTLQLEDDPAAALDAALTALLAGRAVVFPTDTVYGLLAAVQSEPGYRAAYALKGRAFDKPLALLASEHAESSRQLDAALKPHDELAELWRAGMLTAVVSPQQLPMLPAAVQALQPGSIGVRLPRHAAAQALLAAEPLPGVLWATSVNRSGEPPATTAEEVLAWVETLTPEQQTLLGLVVLSDTPGSGVPSRVVDLTGPEPRVLR